jgi:alpha-L-fucosidase 2
LSPGGNVFEATYTNPAGCVSQQQFSITEGSPSGDLIPNGVYAITNLRSGLAIDDPSGSGALNAQVRQWTVNDATEQQWVVDNLGSNVIVLTNVLSGLALSVRAGSAVNGALIDQESYQGLTSQQWTVSSVPGKAFALTNGNGGLALEIYAGGTPWGSETLGEVLDQYSYSGGSWQQWRFASP